MYGIFIFLISLHAAAAMFTPGSCDRRCFQHYDKDLNCQCNNECRHYHNCCPDFTALCEKSTSTHSTSCKGRCETRYAAGDKCQCNSACRRFSDCCNDYTSVCSHGGHTGSSSSSSSFHSVDLSKLADQMWDVDPYKVNITDITLNIGNHISTGSKTDASRNHLFTGVRTNVFTHPMYQALFALYDNYNPNRGVADPLSHSDTVEIDHLLDVMMESPVMETAYNYLVNNKIFTGDQSAFKGKIFQLWFQPYPRSHGSAKDSSAFEHVFIGEYKGSIVEGFHNWIRFFKEESAGHINYLGYMKQNGPQMLEFSFFWNNHYKEIDSFIIGSSPAFDIALGTVCFLIKPGSQCPYTLKGHPFKIQQYDDTNASGPEIATSYTVF